MSRWQSTIEGVKVGDELIHETGSRYHSDETVVVTRIGRKFVYVARKGFEKSELNSRFELATGLQDSNYGSKSRLYTQAAYDAMKRRASIRERLRAVGIGWDFKAEQYSTDKLERVAEILEADCLFHGRPYAEHDFTYGSQCRRCGTEAE